LQYKPRASLIKPAVKPLASAGLSFGTEKALKKIFGNGYGVNKVKLYKLVQAMSPDQKKAVEVFLVAKGMVRACGTKQYGGFLGIHINPPLFFSSWDDYKKNDVQRRSAFQF